MTADALRLVGIVALPVVVETAAWATPAGAELRLWINRPGSARTLQLRVLPERRIEELPALALVAAGALRCERESILTGADPAGRALVLGVADDGGTAWRHALAGPTPTRWPVPVCAARPVVVWQTSSERLELAEIGADGIAAARSVPVGGPPLDVAGTGGAGGAGGAVWAAWTESAGIACAEITGQGVRAHAIAASFPSDVAVGAGPGGDGCGAAGPGGAWVAWTERGAAFVTRIGATPAEVVAVDLGDAAGGTLAVVPGQQPVLWAQRGEISEGEAPRWTSALAVPGRQPVLVDGPVHAVAWWGDVLAVVGTERLYLFEPAGPWHG